jgi:pimeloyl-ACP methyl ester carboxylesterase
MIDQRGTGADALRCPALQRAMGTSDLTVPPPAAVTDCAERIGPRREDFTTADTVADLEALRAALGDRRWAIGGVSYGSFTAERYALAHPGRVRALFLDSVVPHAGVDALAVGDLRPVVRVLRLACRRSAGGCASDPAADLHAVLQRDGGGPAIADTVTALSIGEPRLTGFVAALHAARAGNRGPLERLEAAVHRAQAAPAAFLSQGLHAATLCADSRFPWAPDTPPSRRPALAGAAAEARAGPGFDTAIATGNGFVALCEHWPPVPAPPRVPDQLPDVPTLLLGGDEDLSTPLEWTRAEAAVAPGGRLVVVHGAGHSTLLRSPTACAPQALARLLDGRPLPGRC